MSSTVQFLSSGEIRLRRARLLEEAGTSVDELRAKREQGVLDVEMLGLLDELEDLDYLSGE